ncbi:hypothetical protein PAHAL_9G572000 [Panicum hallii]|uniref:Uncharacterized protein n=1 Tax=Panicum hallii TaxID=206008 RepID=A0A2T8I626_9POAL|nr:hypothetical protein PAHAL_9G572000 [Panicum hallii]PVH33118.1 hypothetical protein PAHAL_9G572000 [Panicum hallii]
MQWEGIGAHRRCAQGQEVVSCFLHLQSLPRQSLKVSEQTFLNIEHFENLVNHIAGSCMGTKRIHIWHELRGGMF